MSDVCGGSLLLLLFVSMSCTWTRKPSFCCKTNVKPVVTRVLTHNKLSKQWSTASLTTTYGCLFARTFCSNCSNCKHGRRFLPAAMASAAASTSEVPATEESILITAEGSHSNKAETPTHPFAACARPQLASEASKHYQDVGPWMSSNQLPLVYHERYNIAFFGIEKLHPFDSCKFRKIIHTLQHAGVLHKKQIITPIEASKQLLQDVHTPEYIDEFHNSNLRIVQVTELPPLMILPNFFLKRNVVSPMKYHVSGTILAAGLALERGWAINVGGGMHHASRSEGMGWCPFDDIMLAIRRLRLATNGKIQKVMVIDLDAHQGNGLERDKLHFSDNDTFILDVYNWLAFPRDEFAKQAINVRVEVVPGIRDGKYMDKLQQALSTAHESFKPDFIFYNAGTDILDGDPLGRLGVSEEGVLQRDELVWSYAVQHKVPICMALSGGYARQNAQVVSRSLLNLFNKFHLTKHPLSDSPVS